MVESVLQDLKHGARMLVKNPGFSLVAIVSIAIGVGANAAMFSVADTLVLRPLTVPRASEIVTVAAVVPRAGFTPPQSTALSYPDYIDVRDQAQSFASLVAYRLVVATFAARLDDVARRAFGIAVSGNLFDTLGVQPAMGRTFGIDEDRPGHDPVVVLDHETWVREFAGDSAVLGRIIRIGGLDMTVIGIMPSGFSGPDQFVLPGYYIPMATLPRLQSLPSDELARRDVRNLAVKGFLERGISVARASEEVAVIGDRLRSAYPDTNRNQGLAVQTEFDARVSARPQLAVIAAMLITLALVVLCVACANVAGLLSSRAPARAREMALRLAIGAGRTRLVRQLVVESLLVAAVGGAIGLLIGNGVIAMFAKLDLPTDVPLKLAFEIDERVLVFGMAIAAISSLASGLAPAWQSTRVDLVSTLKNQAAADPRRSRLWGRNLLVSGQVALSLVLLTIAVFLYRGFAIEFGRGPGYRLDHVLLASFDPDLASYDATKAERFYRELRDKTRAIAGVRSVALTSSVPMDGISVENSAVVPEGTVLPSGTTFVRVRSAHVDEGYFDTLDIAILNGRAFRASDDADAPRVAIVNDTFASKYWPGANAVGRRFRLAEGDQQPWVEVVGVAVTHKYRALSEAATEFVYYPWAQKPTNDTTMLVETSGDPAATASPLRAVVRGIDSNMPVLSMRTMEDFFRASSVTFTSVIVRVVFGMGSMGLALAMIGLYGLVAYFVSRRTREIGIRVAVGANPRSVLAMVLRHGALLSFGGTLMGLLASVAIRGALRAVFPFEDAGNLDVSTYLIVVPALLAITLTAAFIPARRASRIDPLMALRQE
jgi:putative ABC transport system permease protein